MTTTIRVTERTRDELNNLAHEKGVSIDAALQSLLFANRSREAYARLTPEELAEYQDEAREWTELDIEVRE